MYPDSSSTECTRPGGRRRRGVKCKTCPVTCKFLVFWHNCPSQRVQGSAAPGQVQDLDCHVLKPSGFLVQFSLEPFSRAVPMSLPSGRVSGCRSPRYSLRGCFRLCPALRLRLCFGFGFGFGFGPGAHMYPSFSFRSPCCCSIWPLDL